MNQYFYTVSSLPALRFEEEPFLNGDSFLEMCAVELSEEDLTYVRGATILLENASEEGEATADSGSLHARWSAFQRELQRQLALIRAQQLGVDAERLPRPDVTEASLAERLRQLMNEDTPLKRELAILRLLWQTVDAFAVGHHFDREMLYAYHVQLQIALRRSRITDSDAGGVVFDEQYAQVAQSLMEIAT